MDDENSLNALHMWREWLVKSEKGWSDALTEIIGDRALSKDMGRWAQEGLHTHRMLSESLGQMLANVNLPSRQDVLDVGERLGRVEEALAAVQVELHGLRAHLGVGPAATAALAQPRPRRTRRPPKQN